ncbi:unnamed protein product [Caenorhabditis bovis]|uniref:Alpha-1,3-glucosyltransferase n=1 Tax=Caenorhabditis bovis TaxID=2654633 RepID=A0A8S1FBP0_9PELO|nr:unnamed protein product [Caenorhabditis bovis]
MIGVILTVGTMLIGLKTILIPAYTSTDFEVHRNWMAVTRNLNLSEWYTECTSEWTLDYPPFFAYFERVLAFFADLVGLHEILEISETAVFHRNVLLFQRTSVIVTDIFYILVCALYSIHSKKLVETIPAKMRQRARIACFILLSCIQSLILIDSIHFQYNSMLTAIFILSIYFIDQSRFLLAALTFSILVNFKHIYVYYALGFVFYYLTNYFDFTNLLDIFGKGIFLATSILVPFIASLGPFLYSGGLNSLLNIASRLFPVSRGLTHAFWAPNFWAIYNLLDLVLYRILKLLKIGNIEAPTYTSGLVQEYSHSVLPNVSPIATLALVVLFSLAVLTMIVVRMPKSATGDSPDFTLYAIFSSLVFFYFGYHVHEKAIILITVPMTILAIKDVKHLRLYIFITTISSFSLFPLLFTPFEVLLKYSIAITYLLLQLVVIKWFTRFPISTILPIHYCVYFGLLTFVEFYNTFVHKAMWGDRFEFAPLMVISVLTSFGVTVFFALLLFRNALRGLGILLTQKARCLMREELIKAGTYSVQCLEDEREFEIIAGVDISASKSNSDIVVVSFSAFSYPNIQHLASFSDTRLLHVPYIPQYLAIREAEVVAEFVKRIVDEYPQYRPDVILCDGFGEFHSRGCGMACHVGALVGIPTIGVAKNLPMASVYEFVGNENRKSADAFIQKARHILNDNKNKEKRRYVPFDLVKPGIFVSVGYGIELDLATRIVVGSLEYSTTSEPIRQADLQSREAIRKYYD